MSKESIGYLGDWQSSIPNKIIKNSNLSLEARFFWTLIKSFASPNSPIPFPGISYLSELADCSENRTMKYLKELEQAELLYRAKKTADKTLYLLSPEPRDFGDIDDKKLRKAVEEEDLSYLKNSNMGFSNMKNSNQSSTHSKEVSIDKDNSSTNVDESKLKEYHKNLPNKPHSEWTTQDCIKNFYYYYYQTTNTIVKPNDNNSDRGWGKEGQQAKRLLETYSAQEIDGATQYLFKIYMRDNKTKPGKHFGWVKGVMSEYQEWAAQKREEQSFRNERERIMAELEDESDDLEFTKADLGGVLNANS